MLSFCDFLLAFFIVTLVGAGSILVPKYINRHFHHVMEQAKKVVRIRLLQRETLPIEDFMNKIDVEDHLQWKAKSLLGKISDILGVIPEVLRPNDRLSDLLRVNKQELDSESQEKWKKIKLQDHTYPFVHDINWILMKTSNTNRDSWKSKWLETHEDEKPRKEEDWIEFISSLTLKEIIETFI